ncbi:MAG: tail fiber domain-containing protein [Bacteriovoracaceae bacterium]|nr:tail fiber domain-containing protein [Bacteriovoracaceae bacterium]
MADSSDNTKKLPYSFGGINDFNLEEIENEVLNDSVYLDVFAGSDVRFKENVKPFTGGLQNILNLQSYTYNYKTKEFTDKNFPEEEQLGLMAQDVEKVAPIAVATDDSGLKYVNYARLAPMLIESIKDLHHIIEEQSKKISELEKKIKN